MAKIAERVKKLQALAAGSEGAEAESAAAMARRLMMEHAITQADVDSIDFEEDPLIEMRVVIKGLSLVPNTQENRDAGLIGLWARSTAWWKRDLCQAVGDYLDLRSSYVEGYPIWTFYGHRSDCMMAIELWGICARQIDQQAKEHLAKRRAASPYWTQGDSKSEGAAFRSSAVQGLKGKFRRLKRQERIDAPAEGFALVMARKEKVNAWVDATYNFRKGRGFEKDDAHNAEGYAVGSKLKLRRDTRVGGTSTKRLEG